MKSSRFWLAVLVAGLVGNVIDFIMQGNVLNAAFYSKLDSMRQDTNPGYFIFGDFVGVTVFTWVFNRVGSVFGTGAKAGAVGGLYLGILINFPTFHFIHLMMKNFPYYLVWVDTIYGIVWYVIIGAMVGAMLKKPAPVPQVAEPAAAR